MRVPTRSQVQVAVRDEGPYQVPGVGGCQSLPPFMRRTCASTYTLGLAPWLPLYPRPSPLRPPHPSLIWATSGTLLTALSRSWTPCPLPHLGHQRHPADCLEQELDPCHPARHVGRHQLG